LIGPLGSNTGTREFVLHRSAPLTDVQNQSRSLIEWRKRVPSTVAVKNKDPRPSPESGITLLELIIAASILLILSSAALPVLRFTIVRQKEAELRHDLREMRDAVDRYKDYSDRGLIRVEAGSEGYPPDLETLVKGVNIGAGATQKIRFLRRIPMDPITGQADWGLRAIQDDPDSTSWGGKNVFDVHTKSQATALDGTKYSDW